MRRTEEQTLSFGTAGPIRRVEVAVRAGAVAVSGAADGALRVHRTIRWVFGKPHGSERVEDGVLRIDGRIDRGPWYVGSEVSYRIELPAGVALQASTDAGAVDIEATDGEVQVQTGAGQVTLARVGGDIRARTRAGAAAAPGHQARHPRSRRRKAASPMTNRAAAMASRTASGARVRDAAGSCGVCW